jgi:hypothetical protein
VPVPHRRTFAKGILPFALSMLAALSPSMAPLASKAGSTVPAPQSFVRWFSFRGGCYLRDDL